jgi:hypothetical protein
VYYISKVLSETKVRYPQVQKLLYAVVLARRKLRHYFEAHPVTVVSSFPLVLTVKIRQPSHEFTFGVGISFIPYPSVLTPVV